MPRNYFDKETGTTIPVYNAAEILENYHKGRQDFLSQQNKDHYFSKEDLEKAFQAGLTSNDQRFASVVRDAQNHGYPGGLAAGKIVEKNARVDLLKGEIHPAELRGKSQWRVSTEREGHLQKYRHLMNNQFEQFRKDHQLKKDAVLRGLDFNKPGWKEKVILEYRQTNTWKHKLKFGAGLFISVLFQFPFRSSLALSFIYQIGRVFYDIPKARQDQIAHGETDTQYNTRKETEFYCQNPNVSAHKTRCQETIESYVLMKELMKTRRELKLGDSTYQTYFGPRTTGGHHDTIKNQVSNGHIETLNVDGSNLIASSADVVIESMAGILKGICGTK